MLGKMSLTSHTGKLYCFSTSDSELLRVAEPHGTVETIMTERERLDRTSRILFVDDGDIASTRGVERAIHPAEKHEGNPVVTMAIGSSSGRRSRSLA